MRREVSISGPNLRQLSSDHIPNLLTLTTDCIPARTSNANYNKSDISDLGQTSATSEPHSSPRHLAIVLCVNP